MKTLSSAVCFLLAVATVNIQQVDGDKGIRNPIVRIPDLGTIEGTYGHTAWTKRKFSKFIDIPYGHTSAEKRFEPPTPPEPFDETYNGYTSDAACPSLKILDDIISYGEVVDFEDCLAMTISTPNRSGSFPVMVYLAGYDLEDTENEDAEADYLLEKDVVLITVQYRGGPFGFLSTLSDSIPGNAGVQDVIQALRYINQYINFFGGNNKQITIFGQYRNAALIHLLTMSPICEKEQLFQQVIYQSGSALMSGLVTRDPLPYAKEFGKLLGCRGLDNIEKLNKCLKTCDTVTLLYAYREMKRVHGEIPFFVIGGPSGILPDEPSKLLENGKYMTYPSMGGVVKNAAMGTGQLEKTEGNYNTIIQNFEKSVGGCVHNEEHRAIVAKSFPSQLFSKVMLRAIWPGVVDLHSLDIKESTSKALIFNAKQAPSYLYAFNYLGEHNRLPNSDDDTLDDVSLTDDNIYLFPFREHSQTLNKDDKHMASIMVDLWTSFACGGVPQSSQVIEKWPAIVAGKVGPYLKLDTVPEVGFYYPDEFFTTVLDTRKSFELD